MQNQNKFLELDKEGAYFLRYSPRVGSYKIVISYINLVGFTFLNLGLMEKLYWDDRVNNIDLGAKEGLKE